MCAVGEPLKEGGGFEMCHYPASVISRTPTIRRVRNEVEVHHAVAQAVCRRMALPSRNS
jgi:hypothetical protein